MNRKYNDFIGWDFLTAEIIIMNKNAIAMAADSAATLGSGEKIFTSSNKLFMLSKFHPVGIMIYNNPEMTGTPWETIIKLFREMRERNSLDTIEKYMNKFLSYCASNKQFFPKQNQNNILMALSSNFLDKVGRNYVIEIEYQRESYSINENDKKKILSEVINNMHNNFKNAEFIETYDENQLLNFIAKFDFILSGTISDYEKNTFKKYEGFSLTNTQKKKLKEMIIGCYIKKGMNHPFSTGIVIAGFGDKEIYPAFKHIRITGVLDDIIIIEEKSQHKISDGSRSFIQAFAQTDMVQSFMNGIHPEYQAFISHYLRTILADLPEKIINDLKIPAETKPKLVRKYQKKTQVILDEYIDNSIEFQEEYFEPILSVVRMLPKDELAVMAESLVNLTMFKRRVSMEVESVGGPIDVAIISKGDGFIWIKRKHYFDSKLNPVYMRQYQSELEK